MGRGRQKAKQTKVARELKYHTSSIDVTALQRELSDGPGSLPVPTRQPPPPAPADPYSYDDEDEDGPPDRYLSAGY